MDDHLKRKKKISNCYLKKQHASQTADTKLKVLLFNGESQQQRLWNTFYFLKYWQKKISIKKGNLYLHCYQAKTCFFILFIPSLTFISISLLSVGNLLH